MIRMKISVALLGSFLSVIAWAKPFNVNGTQIEVPAPPNLTLSEPKFEGVYEYFETVMKVQRENSTQINPLAYYFSEQDVQAELNEIRTCSISDMRKNSTKPMTESDFQFVKSLLKNQYAMGLIMKAGEKKGEVVFGELSKEVENSVGLKMNVLDVKLEQPRIISETNDIISILIPTNPSVKFDNEVNDTPMLALVSIIRVKNKAITLHCYSRQDQQQWLINTGNTWVNSILKANQ